MMTPEQEARLRNWLSPKPGIEYEPLRSTDVSACLAALAAERAARERAEARHANWLAKFEAVLGPHRERRQTDEPARADYEEVRRLAVRAERAEAVAASLHTEQGRLAVALGVCDGPGHCYRDDELLSACQDLRERLDRAEGAVAQMRKAAGS